MDLIPDVLLTFQYYLRYRLLKRTQNSRNRKLYQSMKHQENFSGSKFDLKKTVKLKARSRTFGLRQELFTVRNKKQKLRTSLILRMKSYAFIFMKKMYQK